MNKKILALVVGMNLTATAQAETPTLEQMWQIIQNQQAEIAELKDQLKENEVITEATITAVEQIAFTPVTASKTTFGGYGEVHYNSLEQDDSSATKDAVDFHRYVMFTGHQFTDSIRFFSELELEHSVAGEGKVGEIELEQAYIEWDATDNLSAKAGLFLMPIGLLNETHEPNTFYGTERNNVEKNIIPATWWEAGAALKGQLSPGLSYDVAAHSGLYIAEGKYKPRDGRQKVGKAKADNMAFTGRLKYTAIPGLEVAASLQYQIDVRQGEGAAIDGTLFETHVAWQRDDFQLRALYARWDFDDVINATVDGASEQAGLYIEPSYKLNEKLGLFARYSQWDNSAAAAVDSQITQFDLGVNYWLHPNVVFKFDYQNQDAPGEAGYDGINMGVGYSF
ncbi:porin [Porticoccaceae bacterium]|nr:porin [Porticoccaceae bacterium]